MAWSKAHVNLVDLIPPPARTRAPPGSSVIELGAEIAAHCSQKHRHVVDLMQRFRNGQTGADTFALRQSLQLAVWKERDTRRDLQGPVQVDEPTTRNCVLFSKLVKDRNLSS